MKKLISIAILALSFNATAATLTIDVPAALPDKCNATAPETISAGVRYLDMTSAWDSIEPGNISLHSVGFREVLAKRMKVTLSKRVPKVTCPTPPEKLMLWGANHDDIIKLDDDITINGADIGPAFQGISGVIPQP